MSGGERIKAPRAKSSSAYAGSSPAASNSRPQGERGAVEPTIDQVLRQLAQEFATLNDPFMLAREVEQAVCELLPCPVSVDKVARGAVLRALAKVHKDWATAIDELEREERGVQ